MTDLSQLVRERFGELTPIQKLAMPKVLSGENVLILAPTGSGKTEAALLPILEKIHKKEHGICALYITPLRALSRDLKERFDWWCKRMDVSHDMRTGDTTQSERSRHRKTPPKILLTTVESLQALLLGKVMRKHLENIEFVIIDEVHDILDNKRGAQLSMGLERLAEIADFKRIAISATVADETEASRLVFGKRSHAICETGKNRKMEIAIESIPMQDGRLAKIKELSEKYRSLVFVNTRSAAEEIGASLKEAGASILVHHGSLAKEVRLSAEDEFKSGKINSIICTSSLELGIDVGDVSMVIQCGSPHQVFRLIQRVGRSGHSMDKMPRGVVICQDFDDYLESQVISVFAANGKIERKRAEQGALDVIAHQVVGLLLDFGKTDLGRIHGILSRSYAYGISYEKLRLIAIQLHGEDIVFYDEIGDRVFLKPKLRAREYYYTFLSTIPKTKRFLMKDISTNRVISSLDEEFVVNLETGSSFLSQGKPWTAVDITDDAVLAQPTSGSDIMVPSWTGEDIPVSFEVAQEVGRMRKMKNVSPLPDDKTIVIEMVQDIVIIHACFGHKVNNVLSRVFSAKVSDLVGESVWTVTDPYRIMLKLPFALSEEHLKKAFLSMGNIRVELVKALENSPLLRFKFLHVGRMFGLLSVDAVVSNRFIHALRNSVVYEEALRSVFFRYFDIEKAEKVIESVKNGKIKLVIDKREKPGYFARIGMDRLSGGEAVGAFMPRAQIAEVFRDNALSKTVELLCLSCGAKRFMHLAGAPEKITCHKCGKPAYSFVGKGVDPEVSSGLIRAYGKRALIALSTYGIGTSTADRVLRRLHRDEQSFYLDLIEAQKTFVKNKKYWKLG